MKLILGNTVIIKQAPETFKCADRLQVAFEKAGLPLGVFQALQMDIPVARTVLLNPLVKYVHFTGSVRGGQEISQILSSRFIGLGLELGGILFSKL
jgi:acyl-CoA reductase-like NAD-dependent aldehyde dehydrogenase